MISIVSVFQAWRKQADNDDSKTFMYYVKDLCNLGVTIDFNLRDEDYQVECFKMFSESEMDEFLEWYGSKEIVPISGLVHYNLLLDNDLLNLRQASAIVRNENLVRINRFPINIKPKFWKFIWNEENKIRIMKLNKAVKELEAEKAELESKLNDIKHDNELAAKAKELIKLNKELETENMKLHLEIWSLREELEEMDDWNTGWREDNVKLRATIAQLKEKYGED